MQDFKDLLVWKKAHDLTLEIYRCTRGFPKEELYSLTKQMRRCSASVGSNIAEGSGKKGHAEFHRYLQIASGSTSELEYHCILAKDLGFMKPEEHKLLNSKIIEVRRMLFSLIDSVDRQKAQH